MHALVFDYLDIPILKNYSYTVFSWWFVYKKWILISNLFRLLLRFVQNWLRRPFLLLHVSFYRNLYFGNWCLKKTCSFTTQIRQRISDFGVLLAILIMVGVDIAVGINTPKLIVPEQFKVGQLLSAKTRFSQTFAKFSHTQIIFNKSKRQFLLDWKTSFYQKTNQKLM